MVEEKKHKLKDLLLSEFDPRYPLTTSVSNKEQIYIPGLQAIEIHDFMNHPEKMIKMIHDHIHNRQMRDTEVNEVSSRSNLVLTIYICLKAKTGKIT